MTGSWRRRAGGALAAGAVALLGCNPTAGDDDDDDTTSGPDGMVDIPGGTFQMGAVAHDTAAQPSEHPLHEVTLSPFRLDLHEVTVAAFRDAVDAGVVGEPSCRLESEEDEIYCNWGVDDRDEHPVNGVDWIDASAYCAWLGLRLPTEAEFEYVLRTGRINAVYPWGDDPTPPDGHGNVVGEEVVDAETGWEHIPGYDDPFVGSAPVGSFDPDSFGVHDVSGNIWEWTQDWFDEAGYPAGPAADPTGAEQGERRVLRGGGFHCVLAELRCSERHHKAPDDRTIYSGFRCAGD